LHALLEEERRQSGVVFDPWSSDLRTNPYPCLHTLRATDPVHWSPLLAAWLLTRHHDVQTFLRQPDLSKDFRNARRSPLGSTGMIAPGPRRPTMLRLDPPDHTRLRSLVSKAFTPRAVEAMRPRIQTLTNVLLDGIKADAPFDLIQELANPLPGMVIAEMLGVTVGDREQFKVWSTDLALGGAVSASDAARTRHDAAQEHLLAYFQRALQERRHHPRDDLLSALLAAQEDGDRLTEEELLGTCILLLVAGNETTTNLIGNGMLALLRQPDQLQLLRREPTRISQAIEELLRYDSPVQGIQRLVTRETVIGGKCITAGTMVMILIGAVNRDPDVFPNPDVLDITRDNAHHVSFGYGIHYCLGAPLARVEASIAIPTLLRRFPCLQLTTAAPSWRDSWVFRGLKELLLIPRTSGVGAR
jgi:cytochrome P450